MFSRFLMISLGFPSLHGISTVFPLSVRDLSTCFRSGPPMQPPKLTEGRGSPGSCTCNESSPTNPKADRCDVQFGGISCMCYVLCWLGRKQIPCSIHVHVKNTRLFKANIPRFIHYLKPAPPSHVCSFFLI